MKKILFFILSLALFSNNIEAASTKEQAAQEFINLIEKLETRFQEELDDSQDWFEDKPTELPCNYVQTIKFEPGTRPSFTGDLHGSYKSFVRNQNRLAKQKNPNLKREIFLGDYVDRGKQGIETLEALFQKKLDDWENVILHRGNHENGERLWDLFGFWEELVLKFDEERAQEIRKRLEKLFKYFPLATFISIEEKITMVCHGGISPNYSPKALINSGKRFQRVSKEDALNILWNDFTYNDDDEGYKKNLNRRIGLLCTKAATIKYMQENGIVLIIRAHQHYGAGCKLEGKHWKYKVSNKERANNAFRVSNQHPVITLSSASTLMPYDCFIILKTDTLFENWMVEVHEVKGHEYVEIVTPQSNQLKRRRWWSPCTIM